MLYCYPGKKWVIYNYKIECIETMILRVSYNIIYNHIKNLINYHPFIKYQ
jgi:hypothetical protein